MIPHYLHCRTDCENILSDLKHQEKVLKCQRRWLMGLPISNSKRENSEAPKFLKHKYLPESLLREDDIFYETVKTHVHAAFGAQNLEKGNHVIQDTVQTFETPDIRVLISCLDALTNNGLYLIAMVLTGGSTKFTKTRCNMKKIIRRTLSKYLRDSKHDHEHKEIITQIYQVVKNAENFQEKSMNSMMAYQPRHAIIKKLLSELNDLPSQALMAMHRKLRCVQNLPTLRHQKMNRSHSVLVNQVRKRCERMLEHCNDDELQEPLAKALAVADLSRRLTAGYRNSLLTGCHQFPQEIKDLQNELVKAIWLVDTKVKFQELESLKLLLDPYADISNSALRNAIKKMLVEYLFECSDMNTIPKSLLEALSIINKNSQAVIHGCFLKDKIEEETDRVLSVSASLKQTVWDLLPDQELDAEFADAYMEELEESDEGDVDSFNACKLPSGDSDSHAESIGEVVTVDSHRPFSIPAEVSLDNSADMMRPEYFARANSHCRVRRSLTIDSQDRVPNKFSIEAEEVKSNIREHFEAQCVSANFPHKEMSYMVSKHDSLQNRYVSIQDICDEAGMIAYNFSGHFLQKFSQEQNVNLGSKNILYLRGYSSPGADVQATQDEPPSDENGCGTWIVEAIKELLPSFPESGLERLKEMVGSSTKGCVDDSS